VHLFIAFLLQYKNNKFIKSNA